MKAVLHERYGEPRDVLSVREVDEPVPRDGEVLVRVRAASIHIGDVHGVLGVPYLLRPVYGLRGPKVRIPGTDIAGTIEAVGRGTTDTWVTVASTIAPLQPGPSHHFPSLNTSSLRLI